MYAVLLHSHLKLVGIIMWSVCGQYVFSMWSVCGQYVVSMWSACGQYVVSMWSACGQYVVGNIDHLTDYFSGATVQFS